MRSLVLVICLCLHFVCDSAAQTFQAELRQHGRALCPNIDLDFGRIRGFPGTLKHRAFSYVSSGTSIPVVTFHNSGVHTVNAMALILEYLDDSGNSVQRIPMVASAGEKLDVPYPIQEAEVWDNGVRIGEDITLAPVFVGVTLQSCPARATLQYARLTFSNGRTIELSSPGWKVDAIPRAIPEIPKELSQTIPFPLDISVVAVIDKTGKITRLSELPPNNDAAAFSWARSFLNRWQFYPAVVDGKPTDSIRTFSLVSDSATSPRNMLPQRAESSLIRFIRGGDPSDPGKVVVYYGDTPESSRFAPSTLHIPEAE